MTKEFQLFSRNSAILLMIVTITTLNSIFAESIPFSDDDNGREANENKFEQTMIPKLTSSFNTEELRRLTDSKMVSGYENDKSSFLKYRHWYNKPRRKRSELRTANSNTESQETQPSPLKSSEGDISRKPYTLLDRLGRSTQHKYYTRSDIIRSRRKRNSDFPYAIFPSSKLKVWGSENGLLPAESRDMNEMWGTRSHRWIKLYHKPSSTLLQIGADGKILGVSDMNKYCIMRIKSVGFEEDKVKVKIYGEVSKMYIAMKRNGYLYATVNSEDAGTDFLHEYEPTSHDAYLSWKYGLYITMRDDGKPARSRNISCTANGAPKRAFFLTSNISEAVKAELLAESKSATSVTVSPTTSVTQPTQNIEEIQNENIHSKTAKSHPSDATKTAASGDDTNRETDLSQPESTQPANVINNSPTAWTTKPALPTTKTSKRGRRKGRRKGRKNKGKKRKRKGRKKKCKKTRRWQKEERAKTKQGEIQRQDTAGIA